VHGLRWAYFGGMIGEIKEENRTCGAEMQEELIIELK